MECTKIISYYITIPKEFASNLANKPREHKVCGAVESECPKTRSKCKITQSCWKIDWRNGNEK